MDRKYIILGGLLFILLVVLVLFIATRGRTQKSTEVSTITIWDSFDNEENFSEIINKYQEKENVEIKFVKKNPATFEQESVNAIAAGTGPDIWVIPNNWLAKDHDKLTPLEEKKLDPKAKKSNEEIYKETYLSAAFQDNVIDSQVYGLPLFMDGLALFYNPELLNARLNEYIRAHPGVDIEKIRKILAHPTTWEDIEELIKYYGQGVIALGGTKVEHASDILVTLMLQYGAQMTSDDKTSALFQTATNLFSDTPYPGTKALSFYTSFAQKDDPHYTWPDAQNSYEAFIKGEVAMYISWSRRKSDLQKDTQQSMEMTSLPQFKDSQNPQDLASYQILTVPRTSLNPQKAWDFILYLESDPILTKYLTKTNLHSATKKEVEGSHDVIDVQNKYSSSWYNPEPAKVEEIFRSAIDQTLAGQNPQTVLEGAAAQVTNLLGELKK